MFEINMVEFNPSVLSCTTGKDPSVPAVPGWQTPNVACCNLLLLSIPHVWRFVSLKAILWSRIPARCPPRLWATEKEDKLPSGLDSTTSCHHRPVTTVWTKASPFNLILDRRQIMLVSSCCLSVKSSFLKRSHSFLVQGTLYFNSICLCN